MKTVQSYTLMCSKNVSENLQHVQFIKWHLKKGSHWIGWRIPGKGSDCISKLYFMNHMLMRTREVGNTKTSDGWRQTIFFVILGARVCSEGGSGSHCGQWRSTVWNGPSVSVEGPSDVSRSSFTLCNLKKKKKKIKPINSNSKKKHSHF